MASDENTMAKADANGAEAMLIALAADRLKRAHCTAEAAIALSATRNHDGAFRILLDIEEPATDATTLLSAVCIVRRSSEE